MTSIFYVSYGLLWVLVVLQSLVLLGLLRTVYRSNAEPALERPEATNGYLIGEPAPEFTAVDVTGARIDETALAGRLTALLFVSPDCLTCTATLDELEALNAKVKGNVMVVCRGTRAECVKLGELYGLKVPVILDEDREVSERFDVRATPTAVLVGRNGRIQTYGQPMRAEELEALVTRGAARAEAEEAHAHG